MRAIAGYIAGALCIIGGLYLMSKGEADMGHISFGIGIYCIGSGVYVIGDLALD